MSSQLINRLGHRLGIRPQLRTQIRVKGDRLPLLAHELHRVQGEFMTARGECWRDSCHMQMTGRIEIIIVKVSQTQLGGG
ncbi:hypothetical protein D1872_291920 [compost metagenome]